MEARSFDPQEVAKFDSFAKDVWDPKGSFRPLHDMNPCRLEYLVSRLCHHFGRDRSKPKPLAGLRILDVGCGGGLVSEPLARLGADMLGIDMAEGMILAAQQHARQVGLEIEYRCVALEAIEGQFDALVSLEVLEHLPDVPGFLAAAEARVQSQGCLLFSTLNRTHASYAFAIVGAERILRLLPRGTHDWQAFITPEELQTMAAEAGLDMLESCGMVFDPLKRSWRLDLDNLSINYICYMLPMKGDGPMAPPPSWQL